ncbi:hypothetical protein GGX14DRAFT_393405 [Mycena pura]|uniref:Uncharacterized protein n=1 Tax=Mycena pura TaxID=153505 RepID=A0AAD6VIF6_9AGAR|nr:hypothetical protein GGX14DRAFT_393405 [Mycena pura]
MWALTRGISGGQGGYRHNDLVDGGQRIRSILWANTGRPVLIDLVTVTRHACDGSCDELTNFRKALGLSQHQARIWPEGETLRSVNFLVERRRKRLSGISYVRRRARPYYMIPTAEVPVNPS